MKKRLWLSLLLAGVLCVSACGGTTPKDEEKKMNLYENPFRIYVNPTGSDTADGLTSATAVKTPERALEVLGSVDDASLSGFDKAVVTLASGRYARTETLKIDSQIASRIPVVVEGAAGGRSSLDAGEQFSGGWTEESGGIWKLDVGTADFRQLYVSGESAVRAREPNLTGDVSSENMGSRWDERNKKLGVEKFYAADLPANLAGAEVHVVQDWTHAIGILSGAAVVDETLWFEMDANISSSIFGKPIYAPGRREGQGVWLENRKEFLDAPGEWYHDAETGFLYYMPKSGENVNALTFTVPRLESLVEIRGTSGDKIRDISFFNLDFENTNWTVPSAGYNDLQATQYLVGGSSTQYRHPPAGIELTFAKNIVFYDCSVRNMGSTGVDFGIGATDCKLLACNISEIAGNGVSVGYFGQPSEDTQSSALGYVPENREELNVGTWIENCEISGIGGSYRGGTGIAGGYVRDITILNNEIHDVSYSGMGLGWGWEAPQTVMAGFVVKNNRVYDCMNNLTCDGGEIYIMGAHDMSGKLSEVSGNFLSSNGNGFGTVYFDTGASFINCFGNVFEGAGIRDGQGTNNGNVTVMLKDDSYSLSVFDNYGSVDGYYFQQVVYPNEEPQSVMERIALRIEEPTVARRNGKWSDDAQKIIDAAGIRKAYLGVKQR